VANSGQKKGPLIKSALAYVDDVLSYSVSIENHFEHLRKIFQRFWFNKIKLSTIKCSFLLPEIVFLGNLVNKEGIGPDPNKVEAMLKFPVPTTQKKLRELKECFSFTKKYILGYSTIVIPLTSYLPRLLKKICLQNQRFF